MHCLSARWLQKKKKEKKLPAVITIPIVKIPNSSHIPEFGKILRDENDCPKNCLYLVENEEIFI